MHREIGRLPRHPRTLGCLSALLIAFALTFAAPTAHGDARSDYLVRLVENSGSFRVRAQALLSLARLGAEPGVLDAAKRALSDDHPAVRVAAAATLETIGDPSALSALRSAERDRDTTVRSTVRRAIRRLQEVAGSSGGSSGSTGGSTGGGTTSTGTPRFYVGVGVPGSTARIGQGDLRELQGFIRDRVGGIEGVVLAPDGESPSAVERVLRRGRLTGYYLDSSIVSVENTGGGVRAVVSVIVGTFPGRDMRVLLNGAASVMGGGQGADARSQAIQGALQSALRRLPQAMEASAGR